ncbi:MAG: glycosyltransferase [Myxococcota bacterium]
MPDLSVVIPARNEELRLPQTLARLAAFAGQFAGELEVLVVDDHSDDNTQATALRLSDRLNLMTLSCPERGPGAAMRHGLAHARADRLMLCDADGPVPFEEIRTLSEAIDAGADIAAGSRLVGARRRPARPLQRRILARGFRLVRNAIAPTSVLDTQCGFKMMRRTALNTVLPHTVLNGFVFHVELLAWAQRLGFRVDEVGVPWRDVPGSSIHPIRDPIRMSVQLMRLRASLNRRRNSDLSTSDRTHPQRSMP